MSKTIETFTADMKRASALLTPLAEPTERQRRSIAYAREHAARKQAWVEDLDWPTTIPEALDAILTGAIDRNGFGMAYHYAAYYLVSSVGSDPWDFVVWSRPAQFLSELGEELASLGVPRRMLPADYFFAGEPFIHLPFAPDGPELGHIALAEAGPVAEAYAAVAENVRREFAYDLNLIIERLRAEHEMWREDQEAGRQSADTLFFWTTG